MRDLKRRKDINERTKIVSVCFLTSLLESTKRGGLKPRAGVNQTTLLRVSSLQLADGDVPLDEVTFR